MRFGNPQMLWLLATVLPLLTWFFVWSWRKRQALIRQFVQSRLLAQLTVGVAPQRQKLRLTLLALGTALVLLALARPQIGFAWEEVRQRGLDILVAIDTSRSMTATDLAPTRLTRAKLAALDLMRAARSDRLGLVAFAGTAFLQCPLTLDDTAFSESVNALDPDIIPQGGTAIALAIDTALEAFKESADNFKVLLLITDGEDHEEGVKEAVQRAAQANVRIFTVGVGTLEGERLRQVDEGGQTTYLKDLQGREIVSKLNVDLLQEIASLTGGDTLTLTGANPMKLLYDARLAPLPRSDLTARLLRQYHERFQWPLGFALLLLALEPFISARRRPPKPPTPSASPPNPGPTPSASPSTPPPATSPLPAAPRLAALLLAPWLGFVTPSPALAASANRAQSAYEKGKYDQARREYESLAKKKPDDPRLLYNTGTAAYQAGDFARATNALGQAVLSPDPELLARAYYNLGNAHFRLGEKADDKTRTMAAWQEALQSYENALELTPNDPDAQFNRDLVKRRIQELQPPQSQKSKDDQKKDSKDDKNDPNKPEPQNPNDPSQDASKQDQESKPEPQNQPESGEPKPESGQDEKQDSQPNQPTPPPKPEESPDAQKDQTRPQPQAAKEDDRQPPPTDRESGAAAAAAPLGQMTPEQARQLLDAAKAEERPLIFRPPQDPRQRNRTRREW